MYDEQTMMPMFTTTNKDEVTLEIDLYRRALDVVFKIGLARSGRGSPTDPSAAAEETALSEYSDDAAEKCESYRFRIHFSHLDELLEVTEPSSELNRTFVISLSFAPFFWRKLHEPLSSIDPGAKYWNVWNSWFRQTGISLENSARSNAPVSLKQDGQIINIGLFPLVAQFP
jgi:hypothetical protein